MTPPAAHIVEANLQRIRDDIARACERAGRDPESVTLIAVTKTVSPDDVRLLHDLGVLHFGENRLHEAGDRLAAAGEGAVWHMIGHIQRRKASGVVEAFDRIDSVDRLELAAALEKRAAEVGKRVPILAEVNVSGEAAKHGFAPAALDAAVAALRQMEHLDIQGLMTMAPLTDDAESVRPYFADLRRMADRLSLPELSMGMSGDYVVAVEEGATQVRIGRALFRT